MGEGRGVLTTAGEQADGWHWAVQVGARLPESQPGTSVDPPSSPWLQSSASWPQQAQQVHQGALRPALTEPGPS